MFEVRKKGQRRVDILTVLLLPKLSVNDTYVVFHDKQIQDINLMDKLAISWVLLHMHFSVELTN